MKAQNVVESIEFIPAELQYMFFENIFKKMFKQYCITGRELYFNKNNHIIDSVIINDKNEQIGLVYLPANHTRGVGQKDLGYETVQELITEFYNHTGIYLDKVAVVNLNEPDNTITTTKKLVVVNKKNLIDLINKVH